MAEVPSPSEIRPATAADLPAILAVEQSCYSQPWSEVQFRDELGTPHAHLDLLLIDGDLAGYHCWWLLCGELHVLNLATAPCFRRRGVAAALLEEALRQGAAVGMERALLEVRAGNDGAIRLYRRFGFVESGRRKGYYPDGEDALLMEKASGSRSTGRLG
ncbi:ribosomal protein S18-alanine N-acetyltransferase [Desulfuromonas carbonis]|uniref:ribosomal protein S18-alanine N-acetyltransferase n=1 Tax=Desulfuromonas sp. DDH964 TaxID=1823759 RepID=UPI00078EDD88|nr:ribosomal protein S18-alanine N-acetyltransferase [Desulfuromonas sp. DDH964]AMV72629.1 ribosomal protein S18 alanine N-acetyltransferase [Desulfuromonas sp. DDH964]